jgi:hypothetical protein
MAIDTPTPEQIHKVLGYLSRQRTKEQRKGGQPKGASSDFLNSYPALVKASHRNHGTTTT